MTPAKPKDETTTQHRVGRLESDFGSLREEMRASNAKFEATLRTGLDNIAARMERMVMIEADQRSLRDDLNRAHDKLRDFDTVHRNIQQILTALQSSMTVVSSEVPKFSAIVNGEDGLITKVARMEVIQNSQRWMMRAMVAMWFSASVSALAWLVQVVFAKVFP